MGVIDDFVSEYERQFDFWEAAARAARGLLEAELASSGLRAMVTSRAKSMDRLEAKLRARDSASEYESVAQVRQDIADLAGVRVALYFPGQMEEAVQVIRTMFDVRKEKHFPPTNDTDDENVATSDADIDNGDGSHKVPPVSHHKRFSGYGARHFRVYIPETRLGGGQERYASALIEVQVASVLMHAWSEVEHDLVYKPMEGELSSSEYALLDQLNGLMLAGEIALEQLQLAGDARISAAETPFRDHYELAEFLRARLSALGTDLTDATLGRIDVLFDYLAEQNSATASSVTMYLDQLETDFERRPVAAQLADLMLSGNESRYNAYLNAMSASRHPSNRHRRTTIANLAEDASQELALGEFITTWVLLETLLKDIMESGTRLPPSFLALLRQMVERGLISPEQYSELNEMRKLRNVVVHGLAGDIPPERLKAAAESLRTLTEAIKHKSGGN